MIIGSNIQLGPIVKFLKEIPAIRKLRLARANWKKFLWRREKQKRISKLLKLLKVHDLSQYRKIRVGNRNGDGGYVLLELPDEMVKSVFSYGVCDDTSFEHDILNYYPNAHVHLFDHTVSCPSGLLPNHTFHQEGVSSVPSSNLDTMKSHFRKFAPEGDRILVKMDIDGAEFPTLLKAPPNLFRRVSQLAIEIHGLSLFNNDALNLLDTLDQHFILTHIHGNNFAPLQEWDDILVPEVLELTYVSRSLASNAKPTLDSFPSALDAANNPEKADYDLNHLAR